MRCRSTAFFGFLGVATAAFAASDNDCTQTACRPGGYKVSLRADQQSYVAFAVPHSPYVLRDGSILIFPGETIEYRLPVEGDKIGKPEFVAEYDPVLPIDPDPAEPPRAARELPKLVGTRPAGTFVVSYGQLKKDAPGMALIMRHNLDRTVKLSAEIQAIGPKGSGFAHTSTCPLMPRVMGMETWPQALGPVALHDIHFVQEGDRAACN